MQFDIFPLQDPALIIFSDMFRSSACMCFLPNESLTKQPDKFGYMFRWKKNLLMQIQTSQRRSDDLHAMIKFLLISKKISFRHIHMTADKKKTGHVHSRSPYLLVIFSSFLFILLWLSYILKVVFFGYRWITLVIFPE